MACEWMSLAIQAEQDGKPKKALRIVWDEVDRLLVAGEWATLQQLLQSPHFYSTRLILALLSSTLPADSRLPNRRTFRAEAEEVISRRGELEPGLLDGL